MDTTDGAGRVINISADRRLLVERLRAARAVDVDPGPTPRPADLVELPLAYAQEQMWLIDRIAGAPAVSSAPLCLRLSGPLDTSALAAAVSALIARHEVLRSTIDVVDGEPRQFVQPFAPVNFAVVEASGDEHVRQLIDAELSGGLDIRTGPMLRVRVYRLDPTAHVLLIVRHHITFDARSDEVLLRDLGELYRAEVNGVGAALPQLPVQYADVAIWQRERLSGPRRELLLTHWLDVLTGAPEQVDLPTSRPAPYRRRSDGHFQTVRVPDGVADRLAALAQAEQVTPLVLFLAILRVVLWRHTGRRDVLVGTPTSVRDRPETQNLIGFFLNMVILRGDLSGDPSVRELVARERDAVFGAFDHQDLPYAMLSRALGRTLVNPLFRITFSYQGGESTGTQQALGLASEWFQPPSPICEYDLEVRITRDVTGTVVDWGYNDEILDDTVVAELAARYLECLTAAAATPGAAISTLPAHRRDWPSAFDVPERTFEPDAGGWSTPDGRLPAGIDLRVRDDHGVPVPAGAVGTLHVEDALAARYAGLPVRVLADGALQLHGYRDGDGTPGNPPSESADTNGSGAIAALVEDVWRELLGIEPGGWDVNLFAIGGHSLTIAQIGLRIEEEFGVVVTAADLFDRPTIRAQAILVEQQVVAQLRSFEPDQLEVALSGQLNTTH